MKILLRRKDDIYSYISAYSGEVIPPEMTCAGDYILNIIHSEPKISNKVSFIHPKRDKLAESAFQPLKYLCKNPAFSAKSFAKNPKQSPDIKGVWS